LGSYLSDIWRLRYFWLSLVRNDLRSRYRRSVIGIGWSLLHPIAMTAVLCTVFSQLFRADVYSYAPFLLAGLLTWNFITSAAVQGCQCFFLGETYIKQCPAPLAIYPLRTVLGAAVHFCLGLLVLLAMVWLFKGFSNLPALPSLLLTLPLLFMFAWAVATCAGLVNVMFQDTQHLTEVGLQIVFYLTPIIYPPDMLRMRRLAWLVDFNPVAAMLDLLRLPICEGRIAPLETFGVAAAAAAVAVICAAALLARAQQRLIFYL